jgi:hypothetical protein
MGKAREIARLPNAPSFSAYALSTTSLTSGTQTRVNFGTEEFDTNSNFASPRFTPTVAGYYQLNARVQFSGSTVNPQIYIQKNGFQVLAGNYIPGTFTNPVATVNGVVYLNGSTDYAEVFGYHLTGSAVNTLAVQDATRFDGCLIRVA